MMQVCKTNPRLAYELVPGVKDNTPAWGVARLEPRLFFFGRGFFWHWTKIVFSDDDWIVVDKQLNMLVEGL